MCSDAPNTTGMNRAAEKQAEIADKALTWYQQIYNDSAPDRARASEAALSQSDVQTELGKFALQRTKDEAGRYDTTFKPIEAKIAADAMAYDTPAAREAAAAQAIADTQTALASARASSAREMARRGVVPGSGRELALAGTMDLNAAKLQVGAANSARQRVEAVGAAKMADAAALGRGVISNQATQAQIGLQAGQQGVANAGVPWQVQQQGAQLGGQGFSTGLSGYNGSGNTYGKIAGIEAGVDANNQNAQMAGASTIAMVGIAI